MARLRAHCSEPQGDQRHQRREDVLGEAEAAEVALARRDVEASASGSRSTHVLAVRERDDVVGVAVPPAHRHGDVAERKPQSRREQQQVAPAAPRAACGCR